MTAATELIVSPAATRRRISSSIARVTASLPGLRLTPPPPRRQSTDRWLVEDDALMA
jgi:hypothetical protein